MDKHDQIRPDILRGLPEQSNAQGLPRTIDVITKGVTEESNPLLESVRPPYIYLHSQRDR